MLMSQSLFSFCHKIYSFYRGQLKPHKQKILLEYLILFKDYNYLNLKSAFFEVNKYN